MARIDYLDFEVQIGPVDDRGYPVAVRSPAGQARGAMRLPLDEQVWEKRLDDLQHALLRSRGRRRKILATEERAVQDLGQQLFESLFTSEVLGLFEASQQQATQQDKVLRLKLCIEPRELVALPWEFLYDPQQGQFVSLSRTTPVVRYVQVTQAIEPQSVTPPLRVMGFVSSPYDPPLIDAEHARQCLEQATLHLQALELIELHWLRGQTWRDLQGALSTGSWHALHLTARGGADQKDNDGFVLLIDDEGESERVSADRLGRLLAGVESLQLVVLGSSAASQGAEQGYLSTIASTLVQRGIAAVLSLDCEIGTEAAAEFARTLYAGLAAGMPLDLAVTNARVAMRSEADGMLAWGIPALYTRAPDMRLCDRENVTALALRRGDEALAGDDFRRAIDQYTLAVELGADPAAQEKRELAEEAGQKLRDAEKRLSTLAGSADDQADAVIRVVGDLAQVEQQLPDSQALQHLLSRAREKAVILRDRLWEDGRRLMSKAPIGLTLRGRYKRTLASILLLERALMLDQDELPALREDLEKARHRLSYLQDARSGARAQRRQRLVGYAILGVGVVVTLLIVLLGLELVPSWVFTARATPTLTPLPSQSVIPAIGLTTSPPPVQTVTPTSGYTISPTSGNTVAPTPIDSETPSPSRTAAPSPADTATPSPADTATPLPTLTPRPSVTQPPTATPTLQPTPTRTVEPRRPTSTPASVRLPTDTPIPGIVYPAPVLLQPEDIVFLSQGTDSRYLMRWDWAGTLKADEWFDVRIWQKGMAHYGVAWTKQPQYVYDICLKGSGDFFWSIAVVRGSDGTWLGDVSPEATPYRFSSSRSDDWCRRHGRLVHRTLR